jgi:pyruvate kinase
MAAERRRTKIVATIGPVSSTREIVRELVDAGVDAFRFNFSHGTHENHAERAAIVRDVQDDAGKALALIADLQGPKLRIGDLTATRTLVKGEEVTVVGRQSAVENELPILPAVISEVLRPGHDVLIDDGLVRLTVEEVSQGRARCRVIVGGEVGTHKGVNLPGVPVPIPSLTKKDLDDLSFALEMGVDFVALSFVRAAADVRDLQAMIRQYGSPARVIAKIEKAEAVEALEEILIETDAVMVARGDLGVEIGAATVPLLQKRIILRCLDVGKPVITATQMLESMIDAPEPTRAEASDVANAILDGTSAIMLSGETAVGRYPVEAVDTMVRIAAAVEPEFAYSDSPFEATRQGPRYISDVVGHAACDMAEVIEAAAIIVPTVSGETAREVSRHRPHRPIVACTPSRDVQRQLMLDWAVVPLALDPAKDVETLWLRSIDAVQRAGIAGPGDRVVITSGTNVNRPGATNTILVQTL